MIIQVEYPKSGGTWVYKMLSYYLNIPNLPLLKSGDGRPVAGDEADPEMARREGCDGENPFPGQKKFGFISQSHELPKNKLFSPKYCNYYLVRDGRDVIVSYYFYEAQYLGKANQNIRKLKILKNLLNRYAGYIWSKKRSYSRTIDLSKNEGLIDQYVAIRAKEWKYHVESWLKLGQPYFRYEDLLTDTHSVLRKIFNHIGADIDEDLLAETIELMSFENCRKLEKGLDQNVRFYRKGIQGDWKNHFTDKQKEIFKNIAGTTLINLGYENNLDW